MKKQSTRLCLAVVVILLGAVVLWASGHVWQAGQAEAFDAEAVGLPSYYGDEGNVLSGLFATLSGVQASGDLPDGFSDEVLSSEFFKGADVYAEGCMVGASWSCTVDSFEAQLEQELFCHGWEHIGATKQSTTYIKDSGKYRWLSLYCGKTSQAATVLVYFQEGGESGAGSCA